MLSEHPRAHLITWTLKGARVHGDPGGSVDKAHNIFGTPRLDADARRAARARIRMNVPLDSLAHADCELVERTIREVATHRGWVIHALAVRSNHVHVVVEACVSPERVMGDFKAWLTRRLRESGRVRTADRPWTKHGSTRYLWDEASTAAAVRYVEEGQDVPRE